MTRKKRLQLRELYRLKEELLKLKLEEESVAKEKEAYERLEKKARKR